MWQLHGYLSFKWGLKAKKKSSFWHKHILQANIQTDLITSYWIRRFCRPIVPICPRAEPSLFIELTSNTEILFLNHSAYSLNLISGLQENFSCSLKNANYIDAISVGLLLLFLIGGCESILQSPASHPSSDLLFHKCRTNWTFLLYL